MRFRRTVAVAAAIAAPAITPTSPAQAAGTGFYGTFSLDCAQRMTGTSDFTPGPARSRASVQAAAPGGGRRRS